MWVWAGVFFSGEPKSGENLGENLGSAMASGYGISTLHCTTVSLAHGGMGLGSAFGPKKYEGLVKEAGFLSFDTVGSNPMNNFCERRSVRLSPCALALLFLTGGGLADEIKGGTGTPASL